MERRKYSIELRSPLKNDVFKIPVKPASPSRKSPAPVSDTEKQQFKISKITAVSPVSLSVPLPYHSDEEKQDVKKQSGVDSKSSENDTKATFKTIIWKKPSQRSAVYRFVSVMEPVRRLPRSSELIKKERDNAKDNISSSTDSLNDFSQKKARLKIPKPAKFLSVKNKPDDKKKKEDSNNNSKKSDSLERQTSRFRRSMGRRQSSKDFDQIITSAPLQKQDSKDLGRGSPAESPTKERAGNLRLQSKAKQVSFEDTARDKPRSGSNISTPSFESTPVKMRPRRNTERIMRDYRLSTVDVQALRCLIEKVDLYDDEVRDVVLPLLTDKTVASDGSAEGDKLSEKVVKDAEKENLKEKLFLCRKELDSYISFCKKMEREKRQTISEKEDLVTKTQWLDKRMSLVESENKALKIERAELLNQVYRLRCPTNVPISERAGPNVKSTKETDESQSDVEISKQRLLYEADAFSQERSKMIKERQRLDEEVRKVQIRCVSLLAQLQHSEKTVDTLQKENEELKSKAKQSSARLVDDEKVIQENIKDMEKMIETSHDKTEPDLERRMSQLLSKVKNSEDDRSKTNQELIALNKKNDDLTRDNRLLTEEKLNLEYELMALQDSIKSDQKARNESEIKMAESDTRLHQLQAELKRTNENMQRYKDERKELVSRIDEMNAKISEMQRNEVEIESDRVAFQKFIEMLSLEMEEKLGEERVSTDTVAISLQDKADQLGKQISAHLTPNRKIQENFQDLKEEVDDLKQENKALKYAMSCRMEIQNMRATQPTCDCSNEKEMMQRELADATTLIDHLEDEVKRLHDDKQSLLLSFLNLQAASRSREPSRTGTDGSMSEDEESGDLSDTEDEGSDEDDGKKKTKDGSDVDSEITDEEDEVSDEAPEEEDKAASDSSGHLRPGLRKALSLPAEALKSKLDPSNPSDVIANLESKLEEIRKTKDVLEDERVSLLDTICKQDQQIDEMKKDIESLEDELDSMHNDESNQSECCGNCSKSGNEIRQYLAIIQSLTEDKLSLEKTLTDIRRDKEQLLTDIETTTQEKFLRESELNALKKDMEETSQKFQKETEYLLQNMEHIEQENKTLEEHLQKARQSKLDLLGDLKMTEQDRFGFVKSLQDLTGDQKTTERKPIRRRNRSEDRGDSVFTGKVSSQTEHQIIVEDYIEEMNDVYSYAPIAQKHQPKRSLSTGDKYQASFQSENAQQVINDLQNEISNLNRVIEQCRKDNRELRKAVDRAEILLQMEQVCVRDLERQKLIAEDEIRSLREEIDLLRPSKEISNMAERKHYLEPFDNRPSSLPQTVRHPSLNDLVQEQEKEKRPQRKLSAPSLCKSPSVSKAKTLCFQISFNGMTLMEKTNFGD